jgi:hypothetical protein
MRGARNVRLYLDTNVLAGVEECAEQSALATWLRDHGHRAVITDVHLAEALAIRDEAHPSGEVGSLGCTPF